MVQEKILIPVCQIISFLPNNFPSYIPSLASFASAKLSKEVSPHPSIPPSPTHHSITKNGLIDTQRSTTAYMRPKRGNISPSMNINNLEHMDPLWQFHQCVASYSNVTWIWDLKEPRSEFFFLVTMKTDIGKIMKNMPQFFHNHTWANLIEFLLSTKHTE